MPLLATDFGASGAVAVLVLSAWAIVLLIVVIGSWYGRRLLNTESSSNRKSGRVVLLLSVLLPLVCCTCHPLGTRIKYGSFPLHANADAQVYEGMTMDEVRKLLGKPHGLSEISDGQWWYYSTDLLGIKYVCIHFDSDGRVIDKHY